MNIKDTFSVSVRLNIFILCIYAQGFLILRREPHIEHKIVIKIGNKLLLTSLYDVTM